MRLHRKSLFGTLGFLSLLSIGLGSAYATKAGGCPKNEDGLRSSRYDVAILISGGSVPKPRDLNDPAFDYTRNRLTILDDLYAQGFFPYVQLTGTPEDINVAITLLEGHVPYNLPLFNGTTTTEDMKAGFEKIGTDSKALVISGEKQKYRASFISNKNGFDPEQDDDYFGVEDTDMPNRFGLDREYIACVATRFGLEKFKELTPFN